MKDLLFHNGRFIVTGFLIIFSLGFLLLFSASDDLHPVFQGLIISVVFFLVIPVLYSKIVLKESLKNIGWQRGNFTEGVLIGIASVVLAGMILVAATLLFPAFREQYTFPVLVEKNFLWFVLYELVLVSLVTFLYEVFFRGFVQLSWFRDVGRWSVALQTALFLGFLFVGQEISWQQAPLIIFCPLAGLIAYRTRSIWYSFVASWTFIFLADIFLLASH